MTLEPLRRPDLPWVAVALILATGALVALQTAPPRPAVADVAGSAPAAATSVGAVPAAAPATGGAGGTVVVAVPHGMLAVTTPYTPTNPLILSTPSSDTGSSGTDVPFGSATDLARGVKILDTRAGRLGFDAHVQAGAAIGLVQVQALQVQGNGLQASDVRATDAPADGPDGAAPRTVASYAGGLGTGSVWLAGTLRLTGPQTGQDTVLVTFTVM